MRPLRMRQAFEQIGYRVLDLTGTVRERRARLAALRERLNAGERPDFLYCENSTQPNLLATGTREGLRAPALDYRVMALMRRHRIPVGVFYRDAYWTVPGQDLGVYHRVANALQRLDLMGYRRNGVHFFLPSEPMHALIGLGEGDSYSALPPAGEEGHVLDLPSSGEGLRLVYVGGLGQHYVLTDFVTALTATDGVSMDLVTREVQWASAVRQDPRLADPRITPLHLGSKELLPVYERAHIGLLTVEPSAYRDIAVPVKLFEYLSYGRPVIATAGTEAGRVIAANGAGWVVPYDADEMRVLLEHLRACPEEVRERARLARAAAADNTWAERARTAACRLTEGRA
nr:MULTISPECIES: glycosyltransferase [unclassified Actinomyces]